MIFAIFIIVFKFVTVALALSLSVVGLVSLFRKKRRWGENP